MKSLILLSKRGDIQIKAFNKWKSVSAWKEGSGKRLTDLITA